MKISKTALFLFELMFVILVFTISAAICTNIFAKAYTFSSESKNLTTAVLKVGSAAEEIKADVLGKQEAYSADAQAVNGENTLPTYPPSYYDKNWEETTEANAVFTLSSEPEWNGHILEVSVGVVKNDEEIYSVVVKTYDGQ